MLTIEDIRNNLTVYIVYHKDIHKVSTLITLKNAFMKIPGFTEFVKEDGFTHNGVRIKPGRDTRIQGNGVMTLYGLLRWQRWGDPMDVFIKYTLSELGINPIYVDIPHGLFPCGTLGSQTAITDYICSALIKMKTSKGVMYG
jgi:hypothetical protein